MYSVVNVRGRERAILSCVNVFTPTIQPKQQNLASLTALLSTVSAVSANDGETEGRRLAATAPIAAT
jgi:hypothetical protein